MAQVAEIDFVNAADRVSGDSLTFARSGVAIDRSGTEIADGTIRTDSITVASPIEPTTVGTYVACCTTADYVYGYSGATLYRTRDGDAWTPVKTFDENINWAATTPENNLLVFLTNASAGVGGEAWRWDGTSWTEVIDNSILADGAAVTRWGVSICHGDIFLAEYKSDKETADNGRRVLWSTDDGATWTVIYTKTNTSGQHLHTLVACVVDGVQRAYTVWGDTSEWAMIRLDRPYDGNDDWDATTIYPDFSMQPTGGFWVPESGAIIWGSDGSGKMKGLFQHDLSDDTFSAVHPMDWHDDDNTNHVINFLTIRKFNGLYVAAGSYIAWDTHAMGGLYVSADAEHWVRAARVDDASISIAGIGPDGNLWAGTSSGSVYCPLPNVAYLKGALIERAGDHRMNGDGNDPDMTAQAGTTVDNEYADDSWTDANCVRWTETGGTPITDTKYVSASGEVVDDISAGDTLYVSFWVKGSFGDGSGNNGGTDNLRRCRVRAQIYDNSDIGGTTRYEYTYFWVTPEWRRVVAPVTATESFTAGNSRLRCYIYAYADAEPEDAEFDILFDGITFEGPCLTPATYHDKIDGTTRNADHLKYDPTSFPAAFTDIFTVASRFCSEELAEPGSSGDGTSFIYLRSYVEDADNFIAVVYDCSDRKVKLVNENGGSNAVVATASTAVHFWRDEPMVIGVTRSTTSATLYVWCAGVYQTASGTVTDHTLDYSTWGCHPSVEQGGSLVFVHSEMWNEALAAATVKSNMQWLTPQETPETAAGWRAAAMRRATGQVGLAGVVG